MNSLQILVRHTSSVSRARAVFEEMNKTPKSLHDSDITRVRKHFMNGDGPAYRQTVVLSSLTTAEMNALLNRACSNWDGRVRLRVDHQVGRPAQFILPLEVWEFPGNSARNATAQMRVLPSSIASPIEEETISIPSLLQAACRRILCNPRIRSMCEV